MKLKGIINDLNERRERHDDYAAIILVRNDIPADADWHLRYDKVPIIDICVDHDTSEIVMVTDSLGHHRSEYPGLLLPEFSEKLQALPDKCREYSLCVGYSTCDDSDDHSTRVDVGIIGLATNKDKLFFGLILWYVGYQSEFKIEQPSHKNFNPLMVRFTRQAAQKFILWGLAFAVLGCLFVSLLVRKALPVALWICPGCLLICLAVLGVYAGVRILLLNPIIVELQTDGLSCANERRFFPWGLVRGVRSVPGHLVLELTVPERYIERRCYRFTKAFGLVWLPDATENEHILSTHGWDTDPESVAASIRSSLEGKKLQTTGI
jgi:hypothetical protein